MIRYRSSFGKDQGAKLEDIKNALKSDAPKHTEQRRTLRRLWRNADDPDEILFATLDLKHTRKFIETCLYGHRVNPDINLPEMLFLES